MTKLLLQAVVVGLCVAVFILLAAAIGGVVAKAAVFIGAVLLLMVFLR